jgi:hypothetical protein
MRCPEAAGLQSRRSAHTLRPVLNARRLAVWLAAPGGVRSDPRNLPGSRPSRKGQCARWHRGPGVVGAFAGGPAPPFLREGQGGHCLRQEAGTAARCGSRCQFLRALTGMGKRAGRGLGSVQTEATARTLSGINEVLAGFAVGILQGTQDEPSRGVAFLERTRLRLPADGPGFGAGLAAAVVDTAAGSRSCSETKGESHPRPSALMLSPGCHFMAPGGGRRRPPATRLSARRGAGLTPATNSQGGRV